MKNKKLMVMILSFLAVILFCIPATAFESFSDVVVSLQIENPIMEINGTATEIDEGRGTKCRTYTLYKMCEIKKLRGNICPIFFTIN